MCRSHIKMVDELLYARGQPLEKNVQAGVDICDILPMECFLL